MDTLDLRAKYIRNEGVERKDLNGASVLMNAEKEDFFGVNPVGTRIWQLLEKPVSCEEVVHSLQEEYEVSEEECESHTKEFMTDLLSRGLIQSS